MTTQYICLIDFIGASSAEHQRNTRVSYHVAQGLPWVELLLAVSQRPIEIDVQMTNRKRKPDLGAGAVQPPERLCTFHAKGKIKRMC